MTQIPFKREQVRWEFPNEGKVVEDYPIYHVWELYSKMIESTLSSYSSKLNAAHELVRYAALLQNKAVNQFSLHLLNAVRTKDRDGIILANERLKVRLNELGYGLEKNMEV